VYQDAVCVFLQLQCEFQKRERHLENKRAGMLKTKLLIDDIKCFLVHLLRPIAVRPSLGPCQRGTLAQDCCLLLQCVLQCERDTLA